MVAPLRIVALLILIVLALLGMRPMWRRAPASTLFLAVYAVIVLFWPYTPGRFVWCVWPFVFLLPVLGVRALLGWSPVGRAERLTKIGALAAATMVAIGYGAYNVTGYRAGAWSVGEYGVHLRPLLVQVTSRTRPNALVATEAENTVFLYTGRQTVPVGGFMATDYLKPRSSSQFAEGLAAVLDHYHPDAVVVSTPYLRAAASELAARQPSLLAVVDSFPGGGLMFVPTRR
jgi:hypothetical protein